MILVQGEKLCLNQQGSSSHPYLPFLLLFPNPDKPEPKKLKLLFTQLGISPTISQIENFDTENRDNAKLYRAAQH